MEETKEVLLHEEVFMNATNVIRVDFRHKAPAAHVPLALIRSPPSHARNLVYRLVSTVMVAAFCWLASLASLLALWR